MSTSSETLGWHQRLSGDEVRAVRNQSADLQAVTKEVLNRARRVHALAFVLTGSTARGRRTEISDLDYHLIGERPDLRGLPGDVDLVSDSLERFKRRLNENDDFAHWTLRYGCVLHDPQDVLKDAYLRIMARGEWPDPKPKLDRALELGLIAEKVLSIGDTEAAQEHVRGGLTSLARGLLLREHVFPLARAELAGQLQEADRRDLADWLDRTIYEQLAVEELVEALAALRNGLPVSTSRTQ